MSSQNMGRFSIALTLVYLVLEFALNARILDVTSESDSDALEGVEFWGRLLFGLACSLIVWKLVSYKALSLRKLLICIVVVGPTAYFGQKQLLDSLVASTTPEFRRQSIHNALAISQVPTGVVSFEQIPLKGRDWNESDGKVFLALFSAFVYSSSDFAASVEKALPSLVAVNVRNAIGPADHAYVSHFSALAKQIASEHEKYIAGGSGNQVAATSEQGWVEYQRRLEAAGVNPLRPTPQQRFAVIRQLRSNSLFLPEGWNLYDRKAFESAWEERARQFGVNGTSPVPKSKSSIPPGLSLQEFTFHPEVQRRIREQLIAKKLHPDSRDIDPAMDLSRFNLHIYEPTVAEEVRRQLVDLTAPAADFADNGRLAALGIDAARKALIPPVAIAFSMFGALLNLFGLIFALAGIAAKRSRALGWALGTSSFATVFGLILLSQSRVVVSEPYLLLIASLRAGNTESFVLSWILDATVRLEPMVYAVGNGLRLVLLTGYTFASPY